MYAKLRFDKKTGKYVVNSADLADATNRMVDDIEYKIKGVKDKLEAVGVLSFHTGTWGTVRHNLNSVQLYIFLQHHPNMCNDVTMLIQETMVAVAMDDREIACSLKDRKHQLGIK